MDRIRAEVKQLSQHPETDRPKVLKVEIKSIDGKFDPIYAEAQAEAEWTEKGPTITRIDYSPSKTIFRLDTQEAIGEVVDIFGRDLLQKDR